MWGLIFFLVRALVLCAGGLDVIFAAASLVSGHPGGLILVIPAALHIYLALNASWVIVAFFAWKSINTHWKIAYGALKKRIH